MDIACVAAVPRINLNHRLQRIAGNMDTVRLIIHSRKSRPHVTN